MGKKTLLQADTPKKGSFLSAHCYLADRTRTAFGKRYCCVVATVLNVYSSWAPVFLRGMDEVLISVRITVLVSVVRFVLAVVLLLAGAGLMSLPLGDLTGSLIQQIISRRTCLRRLGRQLIPAKVDVLQKLRILWPNSWRLGLLSLGGYLTVNANMTICLKVFEIGRAHV